MKYKGEEKKFDLSLVSIVRMILIFAVPITAFSIAIFFPAIFLYFLLKIIDLSNILYFFIFSIAIILSYLILIFSSIFSTALFINGLRLKYKEGRYGKSLKDKTAFKYTLYFALYYPTYKLINIFVLPPIKSFYLSLIGCKIGKNVFLAGEEWIADPCVIEIGDNTMIGGRSLITGHLAEDKLIVKKVKIGKNCLIGGESFIMPGVTIEDNVVVGAKSLVTKNKILESGKIYAGLPVKEIK
ncbi:MAG TPA: hypothetical protein ENI33_07925 [Thermoplasmatales archaeon]|nr:hypothetical protein [Thermoplasmatales archaeon]